MLKIDYRNPMAKTFQYEYALYSLVSDLFYDVQCTSSFALETLKLYYKDLVNLNKLGHASYEKQYAIEDTMQKWIKRDVIGSIRFPQMDRCRAYAEIKKCADGSHRIVYYDGIYAFSVALKWDKKKRRIIGIETNAPA